LTTNTHCHMWQSGANPSHCTKPLWTKRNLMSACSAGPNCKRLMASLRLAQGYEGPEQFILSRNLPIELPDHDVIEKGRPQVAAGLIAPIIPEHPCMFSPSQRVTVAFTTSGQIRQRFHLSRVCINHLCDLRRYRARCSTSMPGLHDYQTRYSRYFSDQ
jgi:hypothetical protein